MLEKCVVTILELNWNQRLEHKLNDKIEHLSSYVHFVHTTAKQVIRTRTSSKCQRMENARAKSQICKFVGFLLPSSSWLFKLRVRTHWTDKICLARPKMSTKFVSVKVSIL